MGAAAALAPWAGCCPQPAVVSEGGDAGARRISPLGDEATRATARLPTPMARPEGWRRGVSLGLFVSTEAPQERRGYYATFLDEIRAMGATDVSLVVRWGQADVRATQIAPRAGVTTPDEVLLEVCQMAAERGLRIFLLPILVLDQRQKGEWRGRLRPSEPSAWWASYTAFILHYAALSKQAGVSMLAVGSELSSMESQDARWRGLIREVRAAFGGALTYSANWDHFEPVPFWDALDVAGVTGYHELTRVRNPDEETLVAGWASFAAQLRRWAVQRDLRFIFTEIGYPSNPFAAARPWDYRLRGEADLELQLRCYRALYRQWHDEPRLEGLYLWNWFGHGGHQDRGYTLRGKPARHVMARWYGGDTD